MPPSPDATTRSIVLMRHGETAWNRERRVMGSLDVPLSERGRRQCERVAAVLGGFAIDRIVTSPLVRAVQSAEIIADALGVPLDSDDDIEEVHFGAWQGRTYAQIVEDPAYRTFAADPARNPTPGGETLVDVQRRGLEGFGRSAAGERVLFVSHGDIIRSAICHYLGMPITEFRRIRVDNCGLTAVSERGGRSEVKFVNMLADPERAWDPLHWSRER